MTVPAAPSLPESDLAVVARFLETATGLRYPPSRRPILAHAVAKVIEDLGLANVHELADLLAGGDIAARTRLLSLATIGETYFFRHPEQLDALAGRYLAGLIRDRELAGHRRLRIWSAGCSTGEEAYTLAILALEALAGRDGWDVRVVGTDIDAHALQRARAAVYGRWSFRNPLGRRARWFEGPDGARRPVAEVRKLVTFHEDSLTSRLPAPAGLDGDTDIVLCRNVLMYLDPEATATAVARFRAALRPGGLLIVAAVETSASSYEGFERVVVGDVTVYVRRSAQAKATRDRAATEPRSAGPGAVPHTGGRSGKPAHGGQRPAGRPGSPARAPRVGRAAEAGSERRDVSPAELLRRARAEADAGQLAEARRLCQAALDRDVRVPGGYALLAAIAEAQDDLEGARAALGRSVYLDRTDPGAQLRLGLLEWRTGRAASARRRLAVALSLAESGHSTAAGDPEGEITVARIRGIVDMMAG